jgi:hypothetical protein
MEVCGCSGVNELWGLCILELLEDNYFRFHSVRILESITSVCGKSCSMFHGYLEQSTSRIREEETGASFRYPKASVHREIRGCHEEITS